mgnify:CR=1 FL=1
MQILRKSKTRHIFIDNKKSGFVRKPFFYARPYFSLNLAALPPFVSSLKLPVQYG